MASSDVASFMSITGSTSEDATQYLSVTNDELEAAVNLYMESGGASMTGQATASSSSSSNPEPDIRAPDSTTRQRLMGDMPNFPPPAAPTRAAIQDDEAMLKAAIAASLEPKTTTAFEEPDDIVDLKTSCRIKEAVINSTLQKNSL